MSTDAQQYVPEDEEIRDSSTEPQQDAEPCGCEDEKAVSAAPDPGPVQVAVFLAAEEIQVLLELLQDRTRGIPSALGKVLAGSAQGKLQEALGA